MKDSLQTVLQHGTAGQARPQAFEPARIIEGLPEDATPAMQDSAIQAQLPERERCRSERPDTLNLPGWNVPSDKEAAADTVRTAYENSLFPRSPYDHPEADFRYSGMVSDPMPYLLRNDDGVTGILLCCFLMLMTIFARSKKYIRQQVQDFFFDRTDRHSLFSVATGREMRHTLFLYLHTGLLVALFAFDYTLSVRDLFMAPVTHFQLLGIYVLCSWAFLGAKQLLYTFVNWILFDKEQRDSWMKSYSFLIASEGLLLFPLALVAVYSYLPPIYVVWCLCIWLGTVKLLLFYKTFSIFFPKKHGFLHLIVYFCALEILPACALWKALMLTIETLL